jgi:hypothetical protein
MSGIGTAIGIAAAVGGAASIGGAAIESSAAGNAANTQADAAKSAAQLQYEESQNALNFQEQEWNTDQSNLAPFLTGGTEGLSQLESLLGVGGNTNAPGYGSLEEGFTAPTLDQAEQYPGYQFGLQQGEGALTNSAAAQGKLLSGGTQEALDQYAQNYAENDYTNVYNQAFNTFETNQANQYGRLAALAGMGQSAASTLGAQGQQAANTVSNVDLTSGAQQGQDLQNEAAAEASGMIGSANAYSGALTSTSGNLSDLLLLSQLGNLNNTGAQYGYGGNYSDYYSTPSSPSSPYYDAAPYNPAAEQYA